MANKFQTVHLDQILCNTKGLQPTSTLSPSNFVTTPYRRSKARSAESISGIDWYYFLVPNDTHVCLIDYVGRNDINDKFIVCATLPNEKNVKKPIRLFSAFNSVLDFIHYVKRIPKERWVFFEVILGSQPQKLYFDIDIDVGKLVELEIITSPENPEHCQQQMDAFAAALNSSLAGRIVTVFAQRGYKIDIPKQILLFSSNSLTKKSYHLIVDGYAVSNYKDNLVLASEVLQGFPEYIFKQKIIDPSMYSAKQQLRLYQSQKPGSGRPKIFVNKWYYGSELIEYKHSNIAAPDEMSREALKFTTLFQASCVTYTHACQIISILFDADDSEKSKLYGHRHKLWAETNAFDDFNDDIINDDIIAAICQRVDQKMFEIYEIYKVLGGLVLLKRKRRILGVEVHCTLCDKTHASNGAFLRVDKYGKVYFYCHSNRDNHKAVADVSDLLTTTKELEKNQLQSVMNQLRGNNTSPPLPSSPPPTVGAAPCASTLHSHLRNLAARSNIIFKSKDLGIPTIDN